MGIGRKKSAKKLWITYKIVNNLSLDGRKVPFLGAIATGPQLLNEGRAAVDPAHQVVDSHVALGVREKFVGEVVLADVVFLHDRCLISSLAISCLSCLSKSQRKLSDLPGNLCKSLAGLNNLSGLRPFCEVVNVYYNIYIFFYMFLRHYPYSCFLSLFIFFRVCV